MTPNLARPDENVSLLSRLKHGVTVCVLCILSAAGLTARAETNAAASLSNAPNIYVDYGQTPPSYNAVKRATNGLGCWIWAQQVLDKQTIYLWRAFQVPQSDPVVHAQLSISADNAFTVWLDGQEIGAGSDWRTLSSYELSGKLAPGTHVLAVEGFNDCDKAGVIVGLRLKLADGRILNIPSDTTWRVVPRPVSGWQTAAKPQEGWLPARFIARLGQGPWWAIPTTVAHIQGSLPEPVPFWRTSRFQFILFTGCAVFVLAGLYLLIQLAIQSKTHKFLQIERDRIARDIHDDLGSKITQLLLTGEASQIRRHSPVPDSASADPVLQMCSGARDILATIDEIIWIVNSQHDTLNDFAIHACKYTERFLESSLIRFRFDVDELPGKKLTQLARRNLFLAVKEALNNSVKHSHATELTVRIRLEGSAFKVIVEDNGIGFDGRQVNPERNGLNNVMLRMHEIGGSSEIISRPGEGCRICLSCPLIKPRFHHFLSKPAHPEGAAGLPADRETGLPAKPMRT